MRPTVYLLIAILSIGLCRIQGQGFNLSSSPNAGNGPHSVAAADINGDGKLDVICANYYDSTLVAFTNNGAGLFISNATYSVGSGANPNTVVAGDLNEDSAVDLVCANFTARTVMVLTNTGIGSFALFRSYNVANTSAVIADMNGDGWLDIVAGNDAGPSVVVLTNDSGRGFVQANANTVGFGPYSVAAVDLNGDGKPDIMSANLGATTLSVLTNNGDCTFTSEGNFSIGSGPSVVTAADLNGDGQPDLIGGVGGFSGSGTNLVILTNNGASFGSNATYAVGTGPFGVAVADLNGDGKPDLTTAGTHSSVLTVLTNNGDGTFKLAASPTSGSDSFSVVAADINGDARLDLIAANFSSHNLSVLTNAIAFPTASSSPILSIARLSNGRRVFWPSSSAGWSLLQSPNLLNRWGPAGYSGYTISDDGTNKSLFVPQQQPGPLFFRLAHP